MAKDPGRRPADAAAFVTELRTMAAGAYGPDWEHRGRSHLGEAAVLLAALWPSAAPAAVQGTAVHRVRLRRHIAHGHAAASKAAVAAGVVVAGGAIAAAVVLAAPTGHAARPPAPTATPTPTPARATTPTPGPAQWAGFQLAAALLPTSDFPAGYQVIENLDTGDGLFSQPDTVPTANCRLGGAVEIVLGDGSLYHAYGTADATELLESSSQPATVQTVLLGQAVYQFASPANAETFFSSVRTCLIDNRAWSHGVDTALVNGDQAVTADLSYNQAGAVSSSTEPLFVLQGTDVFALSAASYTSPGTPTIPGAAELIAELIARVNALGPAPSGVNLPAPTAVPSPVASAAASPASSSVASPAAPPRQQVAQALAGLLAQSGTDRTAISQAFNAVADCSAGLSQDETIFSTAASSRQDLLAELAALTDRSALPAAMLQDLTMAWQVSGEADQNFARWTQDEISRGCSTDDQSDASYQAAKVPDNQATTYKKAFVALWTPIANEYGLPLYQYSQI